MTPRRSLEVEVKFRITSLPFIRARLKRAGFREITRRTYEENTLYDTPRNDLRRKGEMLRLRRYGRKWTMTHKGKGKAGRHKMRPEAETAVTNPEHAIALLRLMGMAPAFRYEKFRSEWSDGEGHVVLDETPVGNFGEIEGPPEWIEVTAKKLAIRSADRSTKTYSELFQAWKRKHRSRAPHMTWADTGQTQPRSR